MNKIIVETGDAFVLSESGHYQLFIEHAVVQGEQLNILVLEGIYENDQHFKIKIASQVRSATFFKRIICRILTAWDNKVTANVPVYLLEEMNHESDSCKNS